MKTTRKKAIFILLGIGAVVSAGFVGCVLFVLSAFLAPTNARDNLDPDKRKEMAALSQEWGRLAEFPEAAENFSIRTEGNMFTRTFRGGFDAAAEDVTKWMSLSPGITEGKASTNTQGVRTIELKTGGGAAYGVVSVSADGTRVTFRVSWS